MTLDPGASFFCWRACHRDSEAGHEVIVLEDLSTGRQSPVPKDVAFVEGPVAGSEAVEELIDAHGVGNEVHFADSMVVPELVVDTLE